MSEELDELQVEFLSEVGGLLDECQESFLNLEDSTNPEEDLAQIFRLAHSVKGTGMAVGFTDFADFAHKLEDLLSILRTFPERLDGEIVSILLEGSDLLKQKVALLSGEASGEWAIAECEAKVLQKIEALNGSPSEAPSEVAVPEGFEEKKTEETSKEEQSTVKALNQTVKVRTDKIEDILGSVSELVVLKSQLSQEYRSSGQPMGRMGSLLDLLDTAVRDIHEKTLSMRLNAIKPLFNKLRRIVRDISLKLDKEIDLHVEGEETEADRAMIESLGDPMVHVVRNAMDHGIESRDERVQCGKPAKARLKISARQTGGEVVIDVQDDGRGIDRQKIGAKAIKVGLCSGEEALAEMRDTDVFSFLFKSGFSTAEKVTDLSGRGVGLDVVKKNIEKLKGKISIDSELGKGTRFSIKLPLTTAITEGVIVSKRGMQFILPTHAIVEILRADDVSIYDSSDGKKVAKVRKEVYPYLEARVLFEESLRLVDEADLKRPPSLTRKADQIVVILEIQGKRIALPLDDVLDQNQFVIKPLGIDTSRHKGFSGGAVLGDGSVALVIDIDSLPGIDREATSQHQAASLVQKSA